MRTALFGDKTQALSFDDKIKETDKIVNLPWGLP